MSDIRIQESGDPDILQTSKGRLTLSVSIQIKRRSGRKLVRLPHGETAPIRPRDVSPTSIQLALARGHPVLRPESKCCGQIDSPISTADASRGQSPGRV